MSVSHILDARPRYVVHHRPRVPGDLAPYVVVDMDTGAESGRSATCSRASVLAGVANAAEPRLVPLTVEQQAAIYRRLRGVRAERTGLITGTAATGEVAVPWQSADDAGEFVVAPDGRVRDVLGEDRVA